MCTCPKVCPHVICSTKKGSLPISDGGQLGRNCGRVRQAGIKQKYRLVLIAGTSIRRGLDFLAAGVVVQHGQLVVRVLQLRQGVLTSDGPVSSNVTERERVVAPVGQLRAVGVLLFGEDGRRVVQGQQVGCVAFGRVHGALILGV